MAMMLYTLYGDLMYMSVFPLAMIGFDIVIFMIRAPSGARAYQEFLKQEKWDLFLSPVCASLFIPVCASFFIPVCASFFNPGLPVLFCYHSMCVVVCCSIIVFLYLFVIVCFSILACAPFCLSVSQILSHCPSRADSLHDSLSLSLSLSDQFRLSQFMEAFDCGGHRVAYYYHHIPVMMHASSLTNEQSTKMIARQINTACSETGQERSILHVRV